MPSRTGSGGLVGLTARSHSRRRPAPKDALSRLPPELLSSIFLQVQALNYNRQIVGAISFTLLPYTRMNLYSKIDIPSPLAFRRLRRTITSSDLHISSLIQSFKLRFSRGKTQLPDKVAFQKYLKKLGGFFSRLTNVSELSISGSTLTAHALLSFDFDSSQLEKLKTLKFSDFTFGFSDPFNPREYTSLDQFPALETLELCIYAEDFETAQVTTTPPPFLNQSIKNIQNLSVVGDLKGMGTWTPLTKLLAHFTNLQRLTLEDDGGVSFSTILSEISPTLNFLNISRSEEVEDLWETDTVDQALPNLTSLHTLILSRDTFMTSIYRTLTQVNSLRHITFQLGSGFTLEEISSLIIGPWKLDQLEVIELDIDEGQFGMSGDWNNFEELTENGGWYEPDWPGDFTFKEALKLLWIVERSGHVRLEGSIRDAITNQEAYDEELIRIERIPFDSLVAMEMRLVKEAVTTLNLTAESTLDEVKQEILSKMRVAGVGGQESQLILEAEDVATLVDVLKSIVDGRVLK